LARCRGTEQIERQLSEVPTDSPSAPQVVATLSSFLFLYYLFCERNASAGHARRNCLTWLRWGRAGWRSAHLAQQAVCLCRI